MFSLLRDSNNLVLPCYALYCNIELAFSSVEHIAEMLIMLVIALLHANGASFFLLYLYSYFRGIYFGSLCIHDKPLGCWCYILLLMM